MIVQTIEYNCDAKNCKNVHAESFRIALGGPTTLAYHPAGWAGLLGGGLYCPQHGKEMLEVVK